MRSILGVGEIMKCIVSKPGWYSGNAVDIFGRCLGRSLARTWDFLAGEVWGGGIPQSH